ncbi:MAG TPA: (2Fe-2S)-binding protein [Candidatus Thermoplasmatota archaeon]|nr:(2Fe-2S)-binding protein [Candidatus Thermoplasmatota archaeon]
MRRFARGWPRTSRTFVCPCEDITEEEIRDAVARGFVTVEEVKRQNGVATGPCQGKFCMLPLQRILCEATGRSLSDVGTITHRPPVNPIPLGLLAGERWKREDTA